MDKDRLFHWLWNTHLQVGSQRVDGRKEVWKLLTKEGEKNGEKDADNKGS